MNSNNLDRAVELLTIIPPVMLRKLHRDVFKQVLDQIGEDITPHHIMIMKVLSEASGTSHPAEMGDMMAISKPQMTQLIQTLIQLGMVRRKHNTKDRRKINILMTEKGSITLERAERLLKERMKAKLSSLKENDLEKLADSLGNMAEIILKIQ